ncbi:DUF983 domain-containing protein [Afifella pfennigii]|uniref:DUF983 domain-containing protein n=1 Tax=Afifella pfennigii TaxID=209897 RepID=UPI000478C508|nr:DUF983 domain-containing protein [Afifella pfennigii]
MADVTTKKRPLLRALASGAAARCPNCFRGPMFSGFLRVREQCDHCGEALHHHRADDAPPYFVVFIVGHVVVALALAMELALVPPLWVHMALWLPLTVAMSLILLRPAKGATVALQWALGMHGFDPDAPEAADKSVDSAWR